MALMLSLIMLAIQAAPITPEGQAAVSSVEQDIAAVRARHAALPAPADDRERLERLGELDQAGRRVIVTLDFSIVPESDRLAAVQAAGELIEVADRENQAALLQLLPAEGWFLSSRYGRKAASAAFHIVQHSDAELWRRFLPVFEPLVRDGEIEGQSYAMMFDRLATSEGRPQRYGTQFRCDGGKWRPYPIEDREQLEARRVMMSFPMPFDEYRAHFERQPSCPQTLSAPPPGMVIDD